ncbi:deaminase, partial [Azospirillum picis]
MTDDELMGLAIDEARAAGAREPADVPIGAVVVGPDGQVLATAGNRREADEDPTAHAEILALRAAA